MAKNKRNYRTLSEIERNYFPKSYEKRHFEQLLDKPKEAGEAVAQKLMKNV
ncbi:MAG: hypothetical protein PWQ75_1406 [Methanolobus sp.]|jgi:hypothetical protein|uniref:Uncharacterized protein n=1 Tax=Methanolobus tindarius DSM 2278 TaxID=1090322 RepID=W9DRM1_METTI|nr:MULTISPECIES: hypothetical protein [Methanolobus]ETA68200.1 hypothetical protein MettiDRAFT_1653 [Methanolobus tindarius DSM 2278]MDK2831654.1 hypothetical protein [Methanolobus sp.]